MLSWVKRILLTISRWHNDKFIVVSLISTLLGVWLPTTLDYLDAYIPLFVIDAESNVRRPKKVVFVIIILSMLWSLIVAIADRYNNKNNETMGISADTIGHTETIYETVGASVSTVHNDIVSRKIDFLHDALSGIADPNLYIGKPCEDIKRISSEISNTLSRLLTSKHFNIRNTDIYTTVFYSFRGDNGKWHRADSEKHESGLSIDSLLSAGSTLYEALHSVDNFVYFHSKEDARRQNKYLPSALDQSTKDGKLKGSIACYRLTVVKGGNTYIQCVICVATYNKQFSPDSKEGTIQNIKHNIENNLLNEYEPLLKGALCDLYITRLRSGNSENQ